MLFDTIATNTAEASLDALWTKTQVIANNMANVDTPGFKASTVGFEQVLSEKSASSQAALTGDVHQAQALDLNQMQAGNSANGDPQAVNANNANFGNQTLSDDSGALYRTTINQHEDRSVRIDGNNVDLEKEQTELWKAYAQYSYLLDRVSGHYNSINSAITNSRV